MAESKCEIDAPNHSKSELFTDARERQVCYEHLIMECALLDAPPDSHAVGLPLYSSAEHESFVCLFHVAQNDWRQYRGGRDREYSAYETRQRRSEQARKNFHHAEAAA